MLRIALKGATKCQVDGSNPSTQIADTALSRLMMAVPKFFVHEVEADGMKMLVAGQMVAYRVGPARDGRSKAIDLRLLNPERARR